MKGRHGGIQVIARAAAIMRELGKHPEGRSLGEVAKALGMPRSTIQRIVGSLEEEGFVEMVGGQKGYRLGPELGRLLYHSQIDAISVVRPLLEELAHNVQETVVFCGLENNRALVIDRVVAESNVLRVVPPMGVVHVPLHSTAAGKTLLATLTDDELSGVLSEAMQKGDIDECARDSLLDEIRQSRKTGIAEDYEEYQEGLAGLSVALDTYLGHFAVALVVPVKRVPAKRALIMEQLKRLKVKAEHKIGRAIRQSR